MSAAPWTWDSHLHPNVADVLAEPAGDGKWCDRLETAATDLVVGKVLCVCAAAAIARAAMPGYGSDVHPDALAAIDLVEQWVDDPSVERFDRLCATIFTSDQLSLADPQGVVWFALRTATSTADGYREAAWALASTCSAAVRAGLTLEQIGTAAQRGVMARMSPTE